MSPDTYASARAAEAEELAAPAPCIPPPPGLVSWWPFNKLLATVPDVPDAVGANGGFSVNNPTVVPGVVGNALQFDGTQQVRVPDDPTLSFADSSFSIDAWINVHTIELLATIVDKRDPVTGRGYALRFVNGLLSFVIDDGTATAPAFTTALPFQTNNWTFVAVTVDRTADVGVVYINGDPLPLFSSMSFAPSDTAVGGIDNDAPLLVADSANPNDRYVGAIDELEIFDRALDPAEVKAIHDAGTGGKCRPCVPPPNDLVSWWPFDEALPDLAMDVAGPNHGAQSGNVSLTNGFVNQALLLDGVDGRIIVSDNASLEFLAERDFTIDAWVRPDSDAIGELGVIIEKWDRTSGVGLRLLLRSETIIFSMSDGAVRVTHTSQLPVPVKQWSFVVVSVRRENNAGTFNVHAASALQPPESFGRAGLGSIGTGAPLLIGGNDDNKETFAGSIDEVELFARALAFDEAEDIHEAGKSGKCR